MKFAITPPETNGDGPEEEERLMDELEEFVVERIVSHRKDDSGRMYLRIRWFGYGPEADTWEPVFHVPNEMIQRYVRRRKLDPSDFSVQTGAPPTE